MLSPPLSLFLSRAYVRLSCHSVSLLSLEPFIAHNPHPNLPQLEDKLKNVELSNTEKDQLAASAAAEAKAAEARAVALEAALAQMRQQLEDTVQVGFTPTVGPLRLPRHFPHRP